MQNINLNAGGIFGGIVGAGLVAAVLFSFLEDPSSAGRGVGKFIALGAVGGAFAGNFLWGQIFTGIPASRTRKTSKKSTPKKKKKVYDGME